MLGDDLVKLLEAAGRSLRERAQEDVELREAMARIGRRLIELADGAPTREEPGIDSQLERDGDAAAADRHESAPPPIATTLRIGGDETEVIVPRSQEQARLTEPAQPTITGPRVVSMPGPKQPELGLIVKRCLLKSEACRWASTRRKRIAEGADFQTAIATTDHELIGRAKALPSCYLWMLDPYGVMPPDDPVLNVIDASYTNLADAASLVQDVRWRQEDNGSSGASVSIEEPVRLLAESQSALRVIITQVGVRAGDQDQIDAFAWLKEFTYAERIYLDRFMRLDNAADPQNWSDLHDRIEALRDEMESSGAQRARRSKLLNRARYHARKLEEGDLDDWRKIMDSIDELVAPGMGVPPSDLDVREILLPLIDVIPEEIELGPGAAQAVREVDRYVASREAAREAAPPPVREVTEEVRQVASLLRGATIVLIGGDERPEASRAIERAFELEKLRWISAKPHQSISTFEPEVARAETALVMLAIRFSSHSFEGVKAMCERYGKPFVRLPGGYGVNQIARQILMQVGNRLAGAIG